MSDVRKHSQLPPSSAARWIACPPSALKNYEIEDQPTEAAIEGTSAHSLCEYKLKTALGESVENPTENLDVYNAAMEEHTDGYLQYILEQIEKAKENCSDPIVLVEQKLDFTNYVPHGFGTGDCVIVADDNLTVIDFKYGLGIIVDAENNPQMMCYAIGALNLFDTLYDIKTITMTIFQPRRGNISTAIITKEELLEWAKTVLKPAAELAIKGKGEYCAGDLCQFCKIGATCRKRAEYNLKLAQYDFAPPATLTDTEIEVVLEIGDKLKTWSDKVKEYALNEALKGKKWNDWTVGESQTKRQFTDLEAVAQIVKEAGVDPYETKVVGIGEMETRLGKKKMSELLGEYIVKPKGKPTLVRKTAAKPKKSTAAEDFKED